MSEELKVGEYVRTIHGEIAIFKGWNNNSKSQWSCKLEFQKIKTLKYCCEEYIVKHSFNILDLIEVGDYVNGKKVRSVYKLTNQIIFECVGSCVYSDVIEGDNIKSIVTHEQFAEMEYKINE